MATKSLRDKSEYDRKKKKTFDIPVFQNDSIWWEVVLLHILGIPPVHIFSQNKNWNFIFGESPNSFTILEISYWSNQTQSKWILQTFLFNPQLSLTQRGIWSAKYFNHFKNSKEFGVKKKQYFFFHLASIWRSSLFFHKFPIVCNVFCRNSCILRWPVNYCSR